MKIDRDRPLPRLDSKTLVFEGSNRSGNLKGHCELQTCVWACELKLLLVASTDGPTDTWENIRSIQGRPG